jgi:hypothetical protein
MNVSPPYDAEEWFVSSDSREFPRDLAPGTERKLELGVGSVILEAGDEKLWGEVGRLS